MTPKKPLWLALVVAALPSVGLSATIFYTAGNAIIDSNGDGTPDALTPQSSNYVFNSHPVQAPSSRSESRTFVEFALPASLDPFASATLSFSVFRYNAPHVPAQQLSVYGYLGNGAITLSDWNAAGTLLGTTSPIAGFAADLSNRGEGIVFNFDITTALLNATNLGASHFSLYFLNPVESTIDSGDPLGYTSLLTVGNYEIKTQTSSSVPDSASSLALVGISAGLLGLAARRRRS